jgi:hypothetical protein
MCFYFVRPVKVNLTTFDFVRPVKVNPTTFDFVRPVKVNLTTFNFVRPSKVNLTTFDFVRPVKVDLTTFDFVRPVKVDLTTFDFVRPSKVNLTTSGSGDFSFLCLILVIFLFNGPIVCVIRAMNGIPTNFTTKTYVRRMVVMFEVAYCIFATKKLFLEDNAYSMTFPMLLNVGKKSDADEVTVNVLGEVNIITGISVFFSLEACEFKKADDDTTIR